MLRICSVVCALTILASGPAFAQGTKATHAESAPAKPAAVVNLNTASAAELQTLPGIGAKVAARIVEYRTKKGPFRKVEELMNVQGIGEKSFLRLKPLVSVIPPKTAER
jgi:competence protein ComEA